jgi:hypothetical protein
MFGSLPCCNHRARTPGVFARARHDDSAIYGRIPRRNVRESMQLAKQIAKI